MKNEKICVTGLDIRLALSVLLCYGISTALALLNIKFQVGEYHLEIVQKMTACISCLLCCQDNTKISFTAGVNRLIITAAGGIVGIVIILIDDITNNVVLFGAMFALGILATMLLCRATRVSPMACRIGCVTLVLVSCTLAGPARIWYGVFRFVSTFVAVLVVLLVTAVSDRFFAPRASAQ